MLYILIVWLNATLLAFVFGKFLESLISPNRKKKLFSIPFTLLLGLVSLSLVVVIWGIFAPINLTMQIGVEAAAVVILLHLVKIKKIYLKIPKFKISWVSIVLVLVYAYLFTYTWIKCYFPTSHYDEGLYYIQFVRWLQTFGFVEGLANLHHRFGFNSTWQVLAAFFDYPISTFFFNDLNGLLFLFFTGYSLTGVNQLYNKEYSLSNFLKVISWLTLIYPHQDMVSVRSHIFLNTISPDWASFIFVALSLILFVEYHEALTEEKKIYQWMSILFSLFSFSVKVSNVSILLIPVYFFIAYLNKKEFTNAFKLITWSTLIMIPWIVSNIILSGYLVFPIVQTQLPFLEWAVPKDYLKSAVEFTKIWSKTVGKPDSYGKMGFMELYAHWYGLQSLFMQNLYKILAVCWICVTAFLFVKATILKGNFFSTYRDILLVYLISLVGTIFWFFNAPDFRFSAVFISFAAFLLLTTLLKALMKSGYYLFFLVSIVLCLTGLEINLSQIKDSFKTSRLPSLTLVEIKRHNQIYLPVSTDQCFDSPLPCTAGYEMGKGEIVPIDSTNLGKGFYIKKH
jgi:hypothetical protein